LYPMIQECKISTMQMLDSTKEMQPTAAAANSIFEVFVHLALRVQERLAVVMDND
jgi:hypothetical protein